MAVTTESIPAQELTYRTNDKPLVIGRHALEIAYTSGSLRANTAGTVAAADASDATYGVKFLQDRFGHTFWKFGSSVTDLYIVIDTGSVDGSGFIDSLYIDGASSWAGRTITVEADSTTPAVPWVGATTVFSFTFPATGGKVLELHASTRYKARYWRIRINGTTNTFQAANIFLGRAVQFPTKSRYEFVPPQAVVGGVIEQRGKGGVRYAYRHAPALQERVQEFRIAQKPTDTTPTAFLPDFTSFWKDSDQIYAGSKPFIYCEDPTTSPNDAVLVYANDTKLNMRVVDFGETLLTLDYTEQGSGT